MRVRRVQEQDLPDLPAQLQAARKASDYSLLEICRRLEITPTYWYKLEREESNSISYELLRKIEELLSVDLGARFSETMTATNNLKPNSIGKDVRMDLSKLQWIKVVRPAKGWEVVRGKKGLWAYTPEHLITMQKSGYQVIHQNGLTIFPLGFRHENAAKPQVGDLMLLTQHAKITHVVEVLDEQPIPQDDWFSRYVKVIWWQPEADWQPLPKKEEILGCKIQAMDGAPHRFDAFNDFREKWEDRLDLFQAHVAEQLSESLVA
jgi:transcriptional regulator with XRE-family HTH domain